MVAGLQVIREEHDAYLRNTLAAMAELLNKIHTIVIRIGGSDKWYLYDIDEGSQKKARGKYTK
jgi:hypothetical protein